MKIDPNNLRIQTVFNTSNIKISLDMDTAYVGTTGHFFLQVTPVNKLNPAEKILCINLPGGRQIKYTHTCQKDIPWLPEAATRAHIVLGLSHTSLISIKMLCDSGCKVYYDARK